MKVWDAKLLAYVLNKDRAEGLPGVSGASMLVSSSGDRISLDPSPVLSVSFQPWRHLRFTLKACSRQRGSGDETEIETVRKFKR